MFKGGGGGCEVKGRKGGRRGGGVRWGREEEGASCGCVSGVEERERDVLGEVVVD